MLTLENEEIKLELTPYAAAIHRFYVKDLNRQIVYPLSSEEEHLTSSSFANNSIGMFCGRITDGRLTLDSKVIQFEKSEEKASLHGERCGLSHQIWKTEEQTSNSVTFSLELKPFSDRLPGERLVKVTYTIDKSTLYINYSVVSSALTFVNLTNHLYFNLSGNFTSSLKEHYLTFKTHSRYENDEDYLPIALMMIGKGSFYDFSTPKEVSSIAKTFDIGLNNAFSLDGPLTLENPDLKLLLSSDSKEVVLYSGRFLTPPDCALALEAQSFPNVESKETLLEPNKEWRRNIKVEIINKN